MDLNVVPVCLSVAGRSVQFFQTQRISVKKFLSKVYGKDTLQITAFSAGLDGNSLFIVDRFNRNLKEFRFDTGNSTVVYKSQKWIESVCRLTMENSERKQKLAIIEEDHESWQLVILVREDCSTFRLLQRIPMPEKRGSFYRVLELTNGQLLCSHTYINFIIGLRKDKTGNFQITNRFKLQAEQRHMELIRTDSEDLLFVSLKDKSIRGFKIDGQNLREICKLIFEKAPMWLCWIPSRQCLLFVLGDRLPKSVECSLPQENFGIWKEMQPALKEQSKINIWSWCWSPLTDSIFAWDDESKDILEFTLK